MSAAVAGPAAGGSRVPEVRFVDRLVYQLQFLRSFWSHRLLALSGGVAGFEATIDPNVSPPKFASACLSNWRNQNLNSDVEEALRNRLYTVFRGAVAFINTVVSNAELIPNAPTLFDSKMADWIWRKRLWGHPASTLSECAEHCLWHAHLLIQLTEFRFEFQLSGQPSSKIEERLLANHQFLQSRQMTSGDLFSHALALWSVRVLLDPETGNTDSSAVPDWNAILGSETETVRSHVFRYVRLNRLLVPESSKVPPTFNDLCQLVDEIEKAGTRRRVRLGELVQAALLRLEKFSHALILRKSELPIGQPISIPPLAQDAATQFAGQKSPLLTATESSNFQRRIEESIAETAEKLFYATVSPRPTFVHLFLLWARRQYYLTDGGRLPLSENTLNTMMAFHSVLALESGARTLSLGPVRQRFASVLSKTALLTGDLFSIERSLTGVRPWLGKLLVGNHRADWSLILPKLQADSRRTLVEVAAQCPQVWLIEPEWKQWFEQDGIAPGGLDVLLHGEGAEPLKKQLVERLLRLVQASETPDANRFNMVRIAGPALEALLDEGSLAATALVAEFYRAFLTRLFGNCERHTTALHGVRDPDQRRRLQKEIQKELKSACAEFHAWFFDLEKETAGIVFRTLVQLLRQRSLLVMRPSGDAPSSTNRALEWQLERQWQSISVVTTRGLRVRRWHHQAQQLLRMFWLNFCCEAFRQLDELPHGLSSGNEETDDLTLLACRIVAHFHRLVRLSDEARDRQTDAGLTPADEESTVSQFDYSLLKKVRDRIQVDVKVPGSFRKALIIRRLLTKKQKVDSGDDEYEWNESRVDELAMTI